MKFKWKNFIFYLFIIYILLLIILQFTTSTDKALTVHLGDTLQNPSLHHWLGTDDYGRDLYARIIVGARYTLAIAIMTLLMIVIIGVPLGLIAGIKKVSLIQLLCVSLISVLVFQSLY
ncbi:hypothetical protein SCA05_01540 [Staphylococcus carnosus]|nr:hypothetical protein SCA05_01540 [Staphylococcus carnosus]SUM06462.1 putative oligopeptide transporter membrane permease Opp-2c [Staphylococcus carnosus]